MYAFFCKVSFLTMFVIRIKKSSNHNFVKILLHKCEYLCYHFYVMNAISLQERLGQ